MTQLSDLVNKTVTEALKSSDGFCSRQAASDLWWELDDEMQATCGIAELARKMHAAAKRIGREAIEKLSSSQAELPFQIDGAVAIDIEASSIRLTSSLTEVEFRRAIEIRQKQIKDDTASLREWKQAGRLMAPFWRKNPDWTFGQCYQAYTLENSDGGQAS